jgi:signal transduction histidine kinase
VLTLAKFGRATRGFRLLSWPALLVVPLLVQAALSLALPRGGPLIAYSKMVYGLALVMAAGAFTLNAVRSRKSIRMFWSFLAAAFGVWSINPCVWIYDVLLLGSNRPAYLPANVPLILRTVLMIAAVASRPHLELPRRQGYRATLNFLLLLFFWVFAYALLLVQQLLTTGDTPSYLRVDALYAGQNFFFLAVLGVLIPRARPPWRLIYWYLLGAATLYVLTSLAANLAFVFRGYRPNWLDLAFTTAACWFVWIALQGRKLAVQLEQSVQPDTADSKYTPLLGMLSVMAIPTIGLWELFRTDEPYRTHELRLFIVLVAVLVLGFVVFIQEYLANRELFSEAGLANERLLLALRAGRMYAFEWDTTTDVILRSGDYADIFRWADDPRHDTSRGFLAKVHPDDREAYTASAETGLTVENPAYQTSFRVVRPDGSVIWLEDAGRAYFDTKDRIVRIVGIVADVTGRKRGEEALASLPQRLIEAQEQERARIARDLHDDIGQRLAMFTIELERLQENSPDLPVEVRSGMGELQKQTSQIATDIQSLSHELHSSKLEYLGLAAAMRGFCKEFGEQQNVEIDFKVHDLPSPLSADISLCLFRVLQEALQNSAKHSGVRNVEVGLWGASGEIHLAVSDSGAGFDSEVVKENRGLGLISMEERLKLVKGTFSIESQPKRGTTIHARVPLSSGSDSMRTAG